MTDRKKPGVAFWATVVLVVVLMYPLSFGPACWLSQRVNSTRVAVSIAYPPLLELALDPEAIFDEKPIPSLLFAYAKLGAKWGWQPVLLPNGRLHWDYCPG